MRSGADAILRLQGRLPRPQIGLKSNFRALQKRSRVKLEEKKKEKPERVCGVFGGRRGTPAAV
jgi:hypothetical protein